MLSASSLSLAGTATDFSKAAALVSGGVCLSAACCNSSDRRFRADFRSGATALLAKFKATSSGLSSSMAKARWRRSLASLSVIGSSITELSESLSSTVTNTFPDLSEVLETHMLFSLSPPVILLLASDCFSGDTEHVLKSASSPLLSSLFLSSWS
uniref:Putative secreted protein n=1 Tax=Ixodes ricinus TaxID=34613 RepID=A0A6B0UVX4_IXORI